MSTRQIHCNRRDRTPVLSIMLHDLAEFGSEVLLIAEFTVILIVLLLLSLMAIPGRVRGRKR
jgi:hypothetical protein